MNLTNPLALWLLPLVAIPLLLTARRKVVEQRVVSSLSLWRVAMGGESGRLSLRRVRRTWIVALQMVSIAAIVLVLAGPVVTTDRGVTVLVFDVSASMSAHEDGATRLDVAHSRAHAIVGGLAPTSRVRLIEAGTSPRDRGDSLASDPRTSSRIDAIAPTAGGSDVAGAVAFAAQRGDVARVIVFSDIPAPVAVDATSVEWVRIGHAADNAAIARVAARPTALGSRAGQVLVAVRNYGTKPREADVEVAIDGRAVHRARVVVPAADIEALSVTLPDLGRVVTARLRDEDALSFDDARWALVPSVDRVRVRLAGARGSFLERALRVNPAVALEGSDARTGVDVIVCDQCDDTDAQDIPRLVIAFSGGETRNGLVTLANATHPLAASLDVGHQTATVVPTMGDANDEVILRAAGVPAVTAADREGHRTVTLHLDLSKPEFALSPAFPVLIANALDWLTAHADVPREITAGEPLAVAIRGGTAESVRVTGPDGRARTVQTSDTHAITSDTGLPGAYRIALNGLERVVIVNPAVDGESDLYASVHSSSADLAMRPIARPGPIALSRWLALLAAALIAIESWFRRQQSGISRRGAIWRTATVVLLILVASGVTIPTGDAPMTVVAALDRSASVPLRAQQQAVAAVNAIAGSLRAADRLGVVTFGADAALELRPSADARLTAMRSVVADTGSDIGAALRLARSVLPKEGPRRIVLMSDGRDTSGAAEHEALIAAEAGVAIDVVPPPATGHPLRVTRVHVPTDASLSEPYAISVEVSGEPGQRGRVALYRDDQLIATPEVAIDADGTGSATWTERQDRSGTYLYRASIDTDGTDASEVSSGAVILVTGKPAILYVSSSNATLAPAFAAAGYSVTRIAPENVPTTASALSSFAVVVLDDVPSDRVRTASMDALSSYIQNDGGGLLLLGSSQTLGLSGYPTTSLERLIPVDLRPRAGQTTSAVDLVIVFDKSGSMSDVSDAVPKIEAARQAVLRAFDAMPVQDRIGVLAFDAQPQVVAPLAAVRDIGALRTALSRVIPGGATSIAPAVATAQQWLLAPDRPPAARRQILLISDGRTSDADASQLRRLARTPGIELSVVAIGPNADRALLEDLANTSGGRAYFPTDLRDLPKAVAREATRSSGGGVVQERFVPRMTTHPASSGIDPISLPTFGGYVVSSAKPAATTILASHLNDPVLAAWRAGLGRVAVFTAGLTSPWSASLRSWKDEDRLWIQTARWLSRDETDRTVHVAIRDGNRGARVEVDAERISGESIDLDDATAVVATPAGINEPIALEPTAPGRYEAAIPVTTTGPYVVAVTARERGSQIEHRVVRSLYWSADRESLATGVDLPLLSRLAAVSGGRVLREGENPFSGPRPSGRRDIAREAPAVALGMFVLDLVALGGIRLKRRQ